MINSRLQVLIVLLACFCMPLSAVNAVELVRLSEANWDDFVPTGKEVDAIYGDWVLRNDQIIVVIANAIEGRNANMTTQGVGGSVIDLTLRKQPNDLLGAYYPASGRKLQLREIRADGKMRFDAKQDDKESQSADLPISANKQITLIFETVARDNQPDILVQYQLDSGLSRSLRIESILSNPNEQPVSIDVKDKIRADGEFEYSSDELLNAFWVYDSWWEQAYGVIPEEAKLALDHEKLKKNSHGRGTEWGYHVPSLAGGKLQPGDSVSIVRRLFVARDSLGIKEVTLLQTKEDRVDALIKVVDQNGPVSGARVDVLVGKEVYGSGRTSDQGEFSASAPGDGKCKLRITPPGRAATEHDLDLLAIHKIGKTIELPAPGTIVAHITNESGGPIPCKVGFYGKGGTPDPMFGPNTYIHGVKNLRYTATGDFRLAIEPGRYDVFISHGPEFDAVIREIEVISDQEVQLDAKLIRTVDTTGWLSAELHSHSSPSGDNTSSQRGRVLNLLAEHLEFIPCTEHNRITTYDTHLDYFDATKLVLTCPGMELTGRLLRVNHQNAFPLIHHPRIQDGGGPVVDFNPEVQIERLAMWDGGSDKLVQTNHPNLAQIFGDRDLDGTPDEGFKKMLGFMDVIEIHPLDKIFKQPTAYSTSSGETGSPVFHWMQLLNLGYRISGVVNTDAHYNFHGSGPLRNFIKSTTDNPAEAKVLDMCHAAEQGSLTMTNGPFMEVSASSSDSKGGPGDDLKSDGQVSLSVRVQCPNWLDVNRVQVFVNGSPDEKLNFTRRTHPKMFADGVEKFNESIQIQLDKDAHLIVAAAGEGLQLGRVMGTAVGKRMPMTVSNPIYVDVDGDGFQANGDMLGLPLPMVEKE